MKDVMDAPFYGGDGYMPFVIAGPVDDEGEPLYWSNVDGWVSEETATVFLDPAVNDPVGATGRKAA